MLVYIKSRLQYESSSSHTQAGWQTGQFGSVQLASFWSGVKEKQGTRVPGVRLCPSLHWVESESLESRLACVGVGVQLWWAAGGQWRVWVLRRRFSRDCKKERRALSSSRGEEPSSSTSAISAKVTGCVLKRASRGRRERLLPLAGHLGTGSCWGNSSIAEAIRWAGRTWKPEASITIWRTAAMVEQEPSEMKFNLKSNLTAGVKRAEKVVFYCSETVSDLSCLALSGDLSFLMRNLCLRRNKARVHPKVRPNKHSTNFQVQAHWQLPVLKK